MDVMLTILLLTTLQSPQPVKFEPIYQRRLNDTLTLVVSTGGSVNRENVHLTQLTVGLLRRGKPYEMTGSLAEWGWHDYKVLRSDDSSLVVGRIETYKSGPTAKLFINPQTYHVIKQIDYPPDVGLAAVNDNEVAATLDLTLEVVKELEKDPEQRITPDTSGLPQPLRNHPMPQSTYAEFARARPDRVKDGYTEEGTTIEESPGPLQIVGSRIWFGKTFYDGEGSTGVGGLGYFDTGTSQYTFLPVPLMADWSTSAILVEDTDVWAALVGYPEGEAYGGGLIRYDLRRRTSQQFPTDEVISRILRFQDRVYLLSKNGAYRIRGAGLIRYRVEPNIDNRFILVTETVAPAPAKH
jgi:hypothetical protein